MHNPPIFITGRFRSGTSFLWHVFDQLPDYCAWYEPLHPQLKAAIEHTKPKADHVGVNDYWQTYRDHPEFIDTYKPELGFKSLYLERDDDYPELENYIRKLIDLSGDRTAILQFNRIDLRLAWIKAKFPYAKILHINRNPLQLYRSQRRHLSDQNINDVGYWDAYELPCWCYSLAAELPIFSVLNDSEKPAFFDFYLLYKLSLLLAKQEADVCIDLEQDIFQSDDFINQLNQLIRLNPEQVEQLKQWVKVPDLPEFSVDEVDELTSLMTAVDLLLSESGLEENFGKISLSQIKLRYKEFWQKQGYQTLNIMTMLREIERQKSEMTRILAENGALKKQILEQAEEDHE